MGMLARETLGAVCGERMGIAKKEVRLGVDELARGFHQDGL